MSKTILPNHADEATERRNAIRYQLTVSAEVVEIKSGTRFSSRTTDLGPGGCFVDTLMPLPIGSEVRVRLHKDNFSFEAIGTVTFSQAGLGMGVAFNEMSPEKQNALDAWLAELTMVRPAGLDRPSAPPRAQGSGDAAASALVQRLIRLLAKRGVISDADAAALTRETLL
ncbi:MAG: PilZ domain-containing protein [Candidatus Acidiferrales bacterium]